MNINRFWDKVNKTDTCWLWTGCTNWGGYGSISNEGKPMLAHRFSYILNIGEIPDGLCVLHRCDVCNCVNPEHLFLGTYKDNNRDRQHKGRGGDIKGDKHPGRQLSSQDVLTIRELLGDGSTTRQMATKFSVTLNCVYKIKRRITWSHI